MIRKKLVRLHLSGDEPSLEGILSGYLTDLAGGHYTLRMARLIAGETDSFELTGGKVKVPRERVVFVQELR